ncbi:C-X-C motif chemokine 6 [Sorex fumeus]|uniref:C-X-C motif chemokine 6 n=1 Tax=Sorex fumeus TaxID=62283 RepID=UPI0024AD5D6B|nr:C-X-C motif chemokine 6 [Sorex fumeus]
MSAYFDGLLRNLGSKEQQILMNFKSPRLPTPEETAARAAMSRLPCPTGSLCALFALLLLLLLAPSRSLANAEPVAPVLRELRCVCLTTTPGIHPKMITNLQVIAAGPQCPRVEIIATLKNRKDAVCLDPQAPLIKKVVKKILDSNSKKNKRKKDRILGKLPSEPVSVRTP